MYRELKDAFKERLAEGDTVYFVEGDDVLGSNDSRMVVKKGTVSDNGASRHYPIVSVWPTLDKNPEGIGLGVSLSPRQLFTAIEVAHLLRDRKFQFDAGTLDIDDLLAKDYSSGELAGILGEAVIHRMADDLIRRPNDPEN